VATPFSIESSVIVVPMPSRLGSRATSSLMARLPAATRSLGSALLEAAALMAIREATSPATCPPIPSATIRITPSSESPDDVGKTESSLLSLTIPLWVAVAQMYLMPRSD